VQRADKQGGVVFSGGFSLVLSLAEQRKNKEPFGRPKKEREILGRAKNEQTILEVLQFCNPACRNQEPETIFPSSI
jgi:hypothetical protein